MIYLTNAIIHTYNRTIKMKPNDVKSSTYFDFEAKSNDKDRKFKNGDCKKIFLQKFPFQICLKKFL